MANGENRAKIKESAQKSVEAITEGTKKLGVGIKDFTRGTVDAIFHPSTIPDKIELCIDRGLVKPTIRAVDWMDDTTRKTVESTDRVFNDMVGQGNKPGRWKVVFAQPLDLFGSFQTKEFPKNEADEMLIDEALKENLVFSGLTSSKRKHLIRAFEPIMVKKKENIITEGDVGDYFYVIGSGDVGFQISGKDVGTAGKGSSFGELALLYDAPRAATCVAKTQCGLFRLDQRTFRRILAQQVKDSHEDVMGILRSVPYFKDLDDGYLAKISGNLKAINYNDGEIVFGEGDVKRFCIVQKGAVTVTDAQVGGSEYKDMSFGKGEFFGEYAITEGQAAVGEVRAKGAVTLLTLDRETFIKVLGSDIKSLVRKTVDKKKLAMVQFGDCHIPDNELDLLVDAIKEKKFPKGTVFLTEGKRCLRPALYLIRSGKVSVRSSNYAKLESILGFNLGAKEEKIIERHGYFGNDLFGVKKSGTEIGVANYTVVALEDVECGVLDLVTTQSTISLDVEPEKETIGMNDLDLIRILGAGTFGKVWLCSHNVSNEAYALKVQVKKQLIEYNQADGVIREKNIMAKLNHPFIIQMVSHWKDADKLYMLMKMYHGGELQSIIHTKRRDGIPEKAAVFYSANILAALSHMHHRNIIYRDLKPENVLLDSEGYTVIIDLGFAKIIKDKTYTFCGTPLYLAPEIIMQKGHNKAADHWSWGVMLYEMIVGMTPFYDGIVDQMGLFKNIVKCRYEFPDGDFCSPHAKDLIRDVLQVNPHDRLGSFARAERDMMRHPFYRGFDWEGLNAKSIKVPYVPPVSDPLDGSNFDDYSKLESKAKKEKFVKLTHAEQRMFDDF